VSDFWKEDWERAKENLIKWWRLEGPAFSVLSPKDEPWGNFPPPEREQPFNQPNGPRALPAPDGSVGAIPVPDDPNEMWLNPELRFRVAEYQLANTFFGGEAFPYFDPHLGPGGVSAFLGAKPLFSETDAWFTPTMSDINEAPPLRFDESNEWFCRQMDIIRFGVDNAAGRFLVCIPDLIENVDTLASLRGTTEILLDMATEPDAVKRRCFEINKAFFEAYDLIYEAVRDEDNGSCYTVFDIWGPGRTYKVQVDLGAMFGPDMFENIVLEPLTEQCKRIDYCLYHLDGSQCFQHLDHILSIQNLKAVEWTPEPGQPGGGHPKWYDLYKRIKRAGKAVQAIWVKPDEIDPLFNVVGPDGMFLQIRVKTESEARELLDRCEKWYR
jgi:hypothetical protein